MVERCVTMRRADRLFRLVNLLRRRRTAATAAWLADRLGTSIRTVYRDVRDLVDSGVPIQGAAGVGYVLRGFDLPPLMFTEDELEALVLGARIVESWADAELAEAARNALAKVEAAVPQDRRDRVSQTALFAPSGRRRTPVSVDLAALRRAIREHRRIAFAYVDAHEAKTERTVQPLGMAFYGPVWLVVSWCELRGDFRTFRPDRMHDLAVLEPFEQRPDRTLEIFLARMRSGGDDP